MDSHNNCNQRAIQSAATTRRLRPRQPWLSCGYAPRIRLLRRQTGTQPIREGTMADERPLIKPGSIYWAKVNGTRVKLKATEKSTAIPGWWICQAPLGT